ncbi:MAG: hypothetical protein J3Q66DRAFT_132941 [Benniella sp.]|nr:MAG: hypothetical protein J3Q66DRAFT_132941 [Benniella sp.]
MSWYPSPLSLPAFSRNSILNWDHVFLLESPPCLAIWGTKSLHPPIAQCKISLTFGARKTPVISQGKGVSILDAELRQRSRGWDSNAMVKVGRCDCLLVLVVGALQLLVIALGIAFWILWWLWSFRDFLRSPALWMALVVERIPFLLVGVMADDTGTSQFKHLELLCGFLDW